MSDSKVGQSRRYVGGKPGRKNEVTKRRFEYFSQAAARHNLDPVLEIKKAIDTNNVDLLEALIKLLRYVAPEIGTIDTNGEPIEKDDVNLNISLNGLIFNNEQSSDD